MSTLIVAGLMAFGLLAIVAAVLLAIDENKTSPTSTLSSIPASPMTTTIQTIANPVPEQRLPAIREDAQVAIVTIQFSELAAQLRALHKQAREIEQRLSILSTTTEQIEKSQSNISSEETEAAHGLINRALTPAGHDL